MKYLTQESFEQNLNLKRGIPQAKEDQFICQTIAFTRKMAEVFGLGRPQVCTALYIFHVFLKDYSFSEFDRYRIGAVCLFTSCKIEY